MINILWGAWAVLLYTFTIVLFFGVVQLLLLIPKAWTAVRNLVALIRDWRNQ